MRKALGLDIDTLGATASFLCAIHCALVPLIVTFGLLSGVSFLADPIWDVVFIGIAVVLASISLVNGYRKHHQKWYPLVLAGLGFLLIGIGHSLHHSSLFAASLSVVGGLLVAVGHLSNYRACRSCKTCRA